MSDIPVFEAKLELECGNVLGEGILWDAKAGLVRWIDIEDPSVHSYDPAKRQYGIDTYPVTRYLTNIALTKSSNELVAMTHHEVAILPASSPESTTPKRTARQFKTLASPLSGSCATDKELRFNDGGCDAAGRLFAGSMAIGQLAKKGPGGELLRYDPDGKRTQILEAGTVGCSNGIGWSPDNKLMYYVDSSKPEISVFDYDLSTGTPTNRRVFVTTPPAMDELGTAGVFDGLCLDGVGNVWVARWRERRIVGYTPEGKIIGFIKCPGALCTTIPCFGGPNLETMYIASASAKNVNMDVSKYPASGHLFSLDFGPESEIRKVLGDGWKGADKHVFGA